MNDTRYLLPLAEKLEEELKAKGRLEWFHQSCQRGLEQTAIERVRDEDEAWRISGAGTLSPRASAVLRALWHWRDREAQAADRPPFHILQNHLLLQSAKDFEAGGRPEFRHLSPRRYRGFLRAAEEAMNLPDEELPRRIRRGGARPTHDMERLAEDLRRRRDVVAEELGLEPSFIAPRAAVESIAADQARSATMLVPWQRDLLKL